MRGVEIAASQHPATLRDYLHVVRRRKWIILQAVILVPAAAVAFSLTQTPRYEASAQVLLSQQNLADALTGTPAATAGIQPDRVAQTQADLARVPAIAQAVLVELHLHDRTPADFLAQSSVSTSTNADLLTFSVTDTDPTLAIRLASAYAAQYTTYKRKLDTQSIEAARREVQARIDALGTRKGSLYASLVEKEQQLRTMEALQTSNAYVVQTPDKAVQVAPRTKRNGALGLVLGIVLGVGLAFLREALDTRVRSAAEIGERLGLPLLARIPEPPKKLREADQLAMLADPAGLQAEAFRMLRTNIEFSTLGREVRTIMVTSAVEEEGKSTTVANLALALARGGQKVILVDLDLRRPYVERFFDLRQKPGITQVALGRASLGDALVRVPVIPIEPGARLRPRYDTAGGNSNGSAGGLAVLGSGPIPPDPGEFVGSHALEQVLAGLAEIADVVVIDAPPLLHVGDALTLSAKVDGLVLVTKLELLRRPMLAEVHRALATAPALKLGFVVTGAEAEEGYGYGYGYGYEYAPRPPERVEELRE